MTRCGDCRHAFANSLERCPHCGRPARFPNVAMAEAEKERRALGRRYDKAVADAEKRGSGDRLRDFELAVSRSRAVIARSLEETSRLASGDHNVYATHHQLTSIEFRVPDGKKWDALREATDAALFGQYKDKVRFAALSLDGMGLPNYGDCFWVLKELMIAHRASVFEENTVVFMERRKIKVSRVHKLPPGYRATWEERARLSVAKLAGRIDAATPPETFAELLLRQGTTSEEDEFVEVHVGGPMTVRTLDEVILKKGTRRRTDVRALCEKLEKHGVTVKEKSWTR